MTTLPAPKLTDDPWMDHERGGETLDEVFAKGTVDTYQTHNSTYHDSHRGAPMAEPQHANLAEALAAFQAEMPKVLKSSVADMGTYKVTYADLAAVTAAAMPLLTEHGLSFSACPRGTDHGYELAGVLLHTSGERLEGALPLYGNTAQQLGSSLTYARRYLLGCMTGIVTDDDDDGRQATSSSARTEKPMTAKTRGQMFALFGQKGIPEDAQLAGINSITGASYTSRADLSETDARAVIDALKKRPDAAAAETEGAEA